MRNIVSGRKSRSRRERLSLLRNTSPPPSPSQYKEQTSVEEDNLSSVFTPSHAPSTPMFPSVKKESQAGAEAIQFVPAYEESLSPATTQPPTSPEDSWDEPVVPTMEVNLFRSSRSQVTPPRPEPRARSRPDPEATAPPLRTVPPSMKTNTSKPKTTRIGRLASLFSSRAIVRGSMEEEEPNVAQDPPPSPRGSEASSGYVGWPGTQDKRGGTVAIESSYDDSEPGQQQRQDPPADRQRDPDQHVSAVSNPEAAASSPQRAQTEAEKVHRMATPMHQNVRSLGDIYGEEDKFDVLTPMTDPWGLNTSQDDAVSDLSTSFSKTSSAYFNVRDVRALEKGTALGYGVRQPRKAAAAVMRFPPGEPQPPTEEALKLNDQLAPPHRTMANAMGFRGLLDKSKDVPNLMDGTESDSTTSTSRKSSVVSSANPRPYTRKTSRQRNAREELEDQILEEASSDIFDGVSNTKDGSSSDIFDGLSNAGSKTYLARTPSIPEGRAHTLGAAPRDTNIDLNLVMLGGGLTTIQTTAHDFIHRDTASDFDDNLTNSDVDQYGFAKIPGFHKMASSGRGEHDQSLAGLTSNLFPSARARQAIEKYGHKAKQDGPASESSGSGSSLFSDPYHTEGWGHNVYSDLQQYYVHPDEMKILVKKYRKMTYIQSPDLAFEELEREEDATKSFALSEMRSRIMEKDIERGLERRGGTTVVDDLVLTAHNRAAMRVRDALIVAKAWRDGATPQDVINTSLMTRRAERAYFIMRPKRRQNRFDKQPQYSWEEVLWVDDLEMSQYRCHSIGPRHLRGFEMFTIGDCQSILLKLCHERCLELRALLNEATARQIEAEEMMKDEADFADGIMTEAEMTYLTSMEQVKNISHDLVVAEKAFSLVKDRIEKLVAKYEALLVKFDNESGSVAPSSIMTASSYYSDGSGYSGSTEDDRERNVLARRAQRAELRAELAAREAMKTKQSARKSEEDKEMEINRLQQQLNDLQSESSAAFTERDHSVVLARAITAKNRSQHGSPNRSGGKASKSKIDDVKQRFRDRSANRESQRMAGRGYPSDNRNAPRDAAAQERMNTFRAVGEEMFQHLDFYERSLKAVEAKS